MASEVTGVVLGGGRSTRMGRDKALLMFQGKPFIRHIVETLQCVFAEVIISANTSKYDFLDVPMVSDVHENCGPLGGIHAAMGSVKTQYVFVAPCDIPLLIPVMVETLLAAAMPDQITIASTLDLSQPLVGVYPTGCRLAMSDFLIAGKRKVRYFLDAASYRSVRLDAWADRLLNVNEMSQICGLTGR